jgi:hypothetical protein
LSVPNTTYICAGSPSLIPASGNSPVRSDTGKAWPAAPNKGSDESDGFANGVSMDGPYLGGACLMKCSTGHFWFRGISVSLYGATGAGGAVATDDVAIESLSSAAGLSSGLVRFGQRDWAFCFPQGLVVDAPELPNSHHT